MKNELSRTPSVHLFILNVRGQKMQMKFDWFEEAGNDVSAGALLDPNSSAPSLAKEKEIVQALKNASYVCCCWLLEYKK